MRAVEALAGAAQAKRQFNAQISEARRAYFAAPPGTAARKAAEPRFAELLLAKDEHFLMQHVIRGVSERAVKEVRGMDRVTGGVTDGGVPQAIEEEFFQWVAAVREKLGAKGPDQLLVAPDRDALRRALIAEEGTWAKYKAARDRYELQRGEGKRLHAALTPAARVKLAEQKVGPFDWTNEMPQLVSAGPRMTRLLDQVRRGGQSVLWCRYGPEGYDQEGNAIYRDHRFWHRVAPPEVSEMLTLNIGGLLGSLASIDALETCPDTATLAAGAVSQAPVPQPPPPDPRAEAAAQSAKRLQMHCASISTRLESLRWDLANRRPTRAGLREAIERQEALQARDCGPR